MTEPGRMALTVSALTSIGAGFPGTSAVVMITVVDQLLLAPDVQLAKLPGVAARILSVFNMDIELDERCAQTLHLLLDDRARVESLDHGTDAPRRRDGL